MTTMRQYHLHEYNTKEYTFLDQVLGLGLASSVAFLFAILPYNSLALMKLIDHIN